MAFPTQIPPRLVLDLVFGEPPPQREGGEERLIIGLGVETQANLTITKWGGNPERTPTLSEKILGLESQVIMKLRNAKHIILLFPHSPDMDSCFAAYILLDRIHQKTDKTAAWLHAFADHIQKIRAFELAPQSGLTPQTLFLALKYKILENLELLDKERSHTRENLVRTTWALFDEIQTLIQNNQPTPIAEILQTENSQIQSHPFLKAAEDYFYSCRNQLETVLEANKRYQLPGPDDTEVINCTITPPPPFPREIFHELAGAAGIDLTIIRDKQDPGDVKLPVVINLSPHIQGSLIGLRNALNKLERSKRVLLHVEQEMSQSRERCWWAAPENSFRTLNSPDGGSVLSSEDFENTLVATQNWLKVSPRNALEQISELLDASAIEPIPLKLWDNLMADALKGEPQDQMRLFAICTPHNLLVQRLLNNHSELMHPTTLEFIRENALDRTWLSATTALTALTKEGKLDYNKPRDLFLELIHYVKAGKSERCGELIEQITDFGPTNIEACQVLTNLLREDSELSKWPAFNALRAFIQNSAWEKIIRYLEMEEENHFKLENFHLLSMLVGALMESRTYAKRLTGLALEDSPTLSAMAQELLCSSLLQFEEALPEATKERLLTKLSNSGSLPWPLHMATIDAPIKSKHSPPQSSALTEWCRLLSLLSTSAVDSGEVHSEIHDIMNTLLPMVGKTNSADRLDFASSLLQLVRIHSESEYHLVLTQDIIEIFLKLIPPTTQQTATVQRLFSHLLQIIPPKLSFGQKIYGLLPKAGMTQELEVLVTKHLAVALISIQDPTSQLENLKVLLRNTSHHSIIARLRKGAANHALSRILNYLHSLSVNGAYSYDDLLALPLPLTRTIIQEILITHDKISPPLLSQCLSFLSSKIDLNQQSMASTLQLYKSLAIETNFSPPISARFTFIARRLQTFSLLYELSKETPFCRALFLIQERLWFLYARNPSTRQRAQEWSHKLSRIIQDETSIYSDQRTVLIELKNLVDHAYQIARIRYDVPLGEPVTRASKLIEACVSLRDSLQPTEHFIFVREILASIHGWAKAFSDISSQLFSALQEDTSIVLDLWFTKLLRAQIEHQLVERLTESYVTITESSLISSKATSKEEEKNPADAINTQVQAAQEKCVLWKKASMISSLGQWTELGPPEMEYLSESRSLLFSGKRPDTLNKLQQIAQKEVTSHQRKTKNDPRGQFEFGNDGTEIASFNHLSYETREDLTSRIPKELIEQFDLPAAERYMVAHSTTHNSPSWFVRLLTFKSSLTFPIYFFGLFLCYFCADNFLHSESVRVKVLPFITQVLLCWVPLGFISLLVFGSVLKTIRRSTFSYTGFDNHPSISKYRRSFMHELLLPRYLISICFGVTAACITELDYSPWSRLNYMQLFVIPGLLALSYVGLHKHVADSAPRNHTRISIDIFSMIFSQSVLIALILGFFFSPLIEVSGHDSFILYQITPYPNSPFSFYPILTLIFASVGLFFATFIEGILKRDRRPISPNP